MGKRRRRGPKQSENQAPKKPVTRAVLESIEGWAKEAVEHYGLRLFDVEVSPGWKIEVTIDTENGGEPGQGVTIQQCADVSRYVEALLDTNEAVPEKYTIEVSSPGLERKLEKARHYEAVVGRQVRLVTHEPIEGQNVFEGVLVQFDGTSLQIQTGEEVQHKLKLSQLAKARLTYDFSGVTEG